MMLNASKAFDRVQYVKLFNLLIQRGICPIMVQFLVTLYTNQQCQIQCCNLVSESNGVEQGGVLSPILFAVYIDEFLIKLRSSGVGGYIGNTFSGAFVYAGDIIFICSTVRALKVMLIIAQNYSDSFDIKFNISKSLLVAYNKHEMIKCAVTFNNVTIESRAQGKHIGNLVGFDRKT